MTFDPMSVEVTCVTLPKDHCVQVPWQYINVCGYSDQFCKIPHTYIHTHTTYILHTYYVQNEWSHSLLLNSVQARQKSPVYPNRCYWKLTSTNQKIWLLLYVYDCYTQSPIILKHWEENLAVVLKTKHTGLMAGIKHDVVAVNHSSNDFDSCRTSTFLFHSVLESLSYQNGNTERSLIWHKVASLQCCKFTSQQLNMFTCVILRLPATMK